MGSLSDPKLAFGTLYPAYSSYKAVKTKNVKEYIAFVIWLLSPYTKGSSVLYRKFVHPTLSNKEKEIDEYIAQARDRSYETMMRFGKRGLNLAANAAVTAATKGQGVLSEKLRSFSMQDLTLIRDEEELHLRSSDSRLRSSVSNLHDGAEDMGGGGSTPRKTAARQGMVALLLSDGDQSDARTEQSDEDGMDKAPKRTASVKTAKKPAAAKTETQAKTVKKPPKKKVEKWDRLYGITAETRIGTDGAKTMYNSK
ncbi:receptor expression-enhancing protein 2-like [Scleropages formosus]|uniref:Receptor expression-enhancing protein 2-like n=1 Tax=Scleropages formosus TaxID=113540 RepID=A0A0P7UK59_SCLFO|nr:receptor expression-enhancing protein 2-like [Scleropages formosus]